MAKAQRSAPKLSHNMISHKKNVRVRKSLVSDARTALQLGAAFFAHHVSICLEPLESGRHQQGPQQNKPPRNGTRDVRGGPDG